MSWHAIIFMIIYGVGIVATVIGGPFYGLLTYLFEYYNHPPLYWWGKALPELRYSFIISLVLLGSYIYRQGLYKDRKILDVPQTKWLILFFGLMLVISFIAITPSRNSEYIQRFLKLVILYLLVLKTVKTKREYDLFTWTHILGSFHLSWQAFENPRRQGGKLYGIGTPDARTDNHLAGILASTVPFIAYYIIYGKKWERLLALITAPFILNAIILCNSRGATIGLLAGVLVWLFLVFIEKVRGLRWKTVVSIVAAGVLFISLVDSEFTERLFTLKDTSREGSGKRVDLWLGGIEMMRDYPLGTGGGGYDFLSSKGYVKEEMLYKDTGVRGAHSTYVLVGVEQGLLGLILFLTFVGTTLRSLHRQRANLKNHPEQTQMRLRSIALESAMVSLLVSGIFITRFYSEVLYWFYGLAASLYQMSKQSNNNSSAEFSASPAQKSG